MLFDFPELVKKHGIRFKGLIQVGAHDCGEIKLYAEQKIKDVILIEANPARAKRLKEVVENGYYSTCSYPFAAEMLAGDIAEYTTKYQVFNYACSDKDNEILTLNISNFDGGLDSLFNINAHGQETSWAPFEHVDKVEVPSITLDTLITEPEKYNFLNVDVEGAELLVFKGATQLLANNIEYVLCETQDKSRFDGSPTREEIEDYLSAFGFQAWDYSDTNKGWGDVLFIRG